VEKPVLLPVRRAGGTVSELTVTWELALTWLAASVTFASLIAVATLGLELLIAANRWPRRFVWLGALAMVVIWPIVGWTMMPRKAPEWVVYPAVTSSAAPSLSSDQGVALTESPAGHVADRIADRLAGLPPVPTVLTVWGVLSGLLALLALRGLLVLWRTRREALRDELLGVPILRTRDVGPAVIGVHRTALLMPDWLWELDECLQRLVLQHELEHRRARDPWLVWVGVVATLLTPWNPAVWFMVRRLRLAMEIDCDARTLRALPDAASQYPRLLLLIAHLRRRPRLVPLLVPSSSQLARRLHAMTSSTPLRSPIARLAVGAFTLAVANAACSRQIAGNLAGPAVPQVLPSAAADSAVSPTADSASGASRGDSEPTVYFDFQVDKSAVLTPGSSGPRYPDALRAQGVQGDVLVQFVVEASGSVRVSSIKVLASQHPELAQTVVAALRDMRFLPAERLQRLVAQLVQQTFSFRLDGSASEVRISARADSLSRARLDSARALSKAQQGARSSAAERGRLDSTKTTAAADRVLFDFEVDVPAMFAPGSRGPDYPAEARARGLQGKVLAEFVVNVDGTVVPGSIRVVNSTDSLFSAAVEQFLPQARFTPARNGSQPVKQLVQQPFEFEARMD
jgi:TonB family protein